MITDNGVAICLDAKTGEEVWTGRVGGTFVASPILANGFLYFCNEEGETTLVPVYADEFEVAHKNSLKDGHRRPQRMGRSFENVWASVQNQE